MRGGSVCFEKTRQERGELEEFRGVLSAGRGRD